MRILNKKKTNKQNGFSLIEVLIAMFILGLVGVAFLLALATATSATILANQRTSAESIARSQMEFVKNKETNAFSDFEWVYVADTSTATWTSAQYPASWVPNTLASNYQNFDVQVATTNIDLNHNLTQISVTVKYNDTIIKTLVGYVARVSAP